MDTREKAKLPADALPEKLPALEKPTSVEQSLRTQGEDTAPRPEIDEDESLIKIELDEAAKEIPRPVLKTSTKSAAVVSIESVLEQDLKDVYKGMPPENRREFKIAGEVTAAKISVLMKSAKFKITKVLELIKAWLQMIPGVSKFFLEQEAKIKTDEIIKLREDLKKRGQL